MTFLGFLIFLAGAALVYSGITGKPIVDEARRILGNRS